MQLLKALPGGGELVALALHHLGLGPLTRTRSLARQRLDTLYLRLRAPASICRRLRSESRSTSPARGSITSTSPNTSVVAFSGLCSRGRLSSMVSFSGSRRARRCDESRFSA